MPVGRNRFVAAKYLSVAVYFAAFLAAVIIITSIISFFPSTNVDGPVMGWSSLVQFLIIAAIYYGVYFPLYFKVGYTRSRWANYISLLAAAGLFVFATRGLSTISGTELTSLQAALEYLTRINMGIWNIILPLLSVLIITVSIRLSTIYYRRREF